MGLRVKTDCQGSLSWLRMVSSRSFQGKTRDEQGLSRVPRLRPWGKTRGTQFGSENDSHARLDAPTGPVSQSQAARGHGMVSLGLSPSEWTGQTFRQKRSSVIHQDGSRDEAPHVLRMMPLVPGFENRTRSETVLRWKQARHPRAQRSSRPYRRRIGCRVLLKKALSLIQTCGVPYFSAWISGSFKTRVAGERWSPVHQLRDPKAAFSRRSCVLKLTWSLLEVRTVLSPILEGVEAPDCPEMIMGLTDWELPSGKISRICRCKCSSCSREFSG
jgi:hypothetical protein